MLSGLLKKALLLPNVSLGIVSDVKQDDYFCAMFFYHDSNGNMENWKYGIKFLEMPKIRAV